MISFKQKYKLWLLFPIFVGGVIFILFNYYRIHQKIAQCKEDYQKLVVLSENTSILTDIKKLTQGNIFFHYSKKKQEADVCKKKSEQAVIDSYNNTVKSLAGKIAKIEDQEISLSNLSIKLSKNKPAAKSIDPVKSNPSLADVKSLKTVDQDHDYWLQEADMRFNDYLELRKKNNEFVNPLWQYGDVKLKDFVASLTLEEKVGQMLMLSINGTSLSSSEKLFLEANQIGGIIFMGSNISTEAQVTEFSKQIQSTNSKIPYLISTDEEGGPVKRVPWDTTAGETSWAEMGQEELCTLGKTRAELLKKIGINLNFSPVADVRNSTTAFINKRTISNDPKIVSEKVKEYRICHRRAGVFTTLKHFPGHGATTEDSHFSLPVINKTKEDWLNSDAIPFKENLDSEMIMVGHLFYKNLDAEKPATQSKAILQDLIRNDLGYRGVLITDAMNQIHRSTGVSVREAIKKAVNNGMDIILYVSYPVPKQQIRDTFLDLVKSGEIDRMRVNESVYRILKLKRSYI